MKRHMVRFWSALGLAMMVGWTGCNPMTSEQQGIYVIFDSNPMLYKQDVYFRNRTIGQIINQEAGRGGVFKVTFQLQPEFSKEAGKHWVFYADNGSLHASILSASGKPLAPGDTVCGFSSKAALNWFKLKTILEDRVFVANQKAESLLRRFGS